jgi:hypothetical protein
MIFILRMIETPDTLAQKTFKNLQPLTPGSMLPPLPTYSIDIYRY